MKVLAAVDFGDPALEALRQARALAHGLGGTLAACHVLPAVNDLASLFPAQAVASLADAAAEEERTRAALLEQARSKLGLELTELYVERGSAYAEIVRRADALHADFIAIGSNGRTGIARALLGSVAERVVRHAHCSVLVARPAPTSTVVLVATDLSEASLPAIAAGATAAKLRGAKLVVCSALEWSGFSSDPIVGVLGALPPAPPQELQQQMHDVLRSTIERAMESAGVLGEARVLDGSPGPAVITCAEALHAELIVVGTRGRTGLARLALGSVAENVIRNAHCSVLAVRL